jgi:dolichol-phosphate mannosyltransferase
MKRILVFTATYNEADNIRELIFQIKQSLPEADILVVDDRSPDETGAILDSISMADSSVSVIHRTRKLGLGSAHKLAMKFALEKEYHNLITMDADFSHDPIYLPKIVEQLRSNDFVIGSRYVKGGRCDYGFLRQLLSRTANLLARILLGIQLHETTTSYRGYSRELLERFPIDRIRSEGYSFFIESIFYVSQLTKRMTEFPIHFVDRRAGTSKISKSEIWKSMRRLLSLFAMRLLSQFRTKPKDSARIQAGPCAFCASHFESEVYPARQENPDTKFYNCTSTAHHSHGRISQCLICGLVQTNPLPNSDFILKMYSNVEDTVYAEHIDARVKTYKYNLDSLGTFLPKSGKLLDVGAYCGVFLNEARSRGYDVHGIEPSTWSVKFAKEHFGIELTNGTLKDLGPNETKFDIVTAWDVMEHFVDPMAELRQINSRMKKGGTFAFCTLNFENLAPRLLGERWPWLMDMHLFYFTDRTLGEMLAHAGFRLVHDQKYCHIITFDYFLIKLGSLGVPLMGLARKFLAITPFAKSFIPFKFGDIKMYVCEKISEIETPPKKTRNSLQYLEVL